MTEDLTALVKKDATTVIEMRAGTTNPIGPSMVECLSARLAALREDEAVRAIVLTGNDKFFSIGLDLPTLVKMDRQELTDFISSYDRLCIDLFTMPKPVVAAIRGHAIAGGCILALSCDYRVMAEGKGLMGLNEVKLGLPVPYPADCILHHIVGDRIAREMMEGGEFYRSSELLGMGVIDEIGPKEAILDGSLGLAGQLGANPLRAFARIKMNRTDPILGKIERDLLERQGQFVDCWFSDEGQTRLKAALEKF